MNYNTVIKRFDLIVNAENQTYSKTFELDKTIVHIKGILLTSDKDDLLYYRGSQKIEINKEEIFPEGFESKLLMCGINVAPNERYYTIGNLPTGNGKIKVDYKDVSSDSSTTEFAPYRVSIYLIGAV
jgi:archaellum component FlaF (FlaF/FlaG flagellin family)